MVALATLAAAGAVAATPEPPSSTPPTDRPEHRTRVKGGRTYHVPGGGAKECARRLAQMQAQAIADEEARDQPQGF